jgi:hypothetical protein
MRKFYLATVVVYGLFAIHLIEEMLRERGEGFDFSGFIPLVLYPISLIAMYLKKGWGLWMALVLNILMLIITSVGHFNPNSHDFVMMIYSHWNGLTGIEAAKIAILVPVMAMVAVLFGVKAIKSGEASK